VSERYEDVILEEARRAIDFQASALDELRARTGILLAAAAVSGSFLGAATARADVGFGFLGGVAVIAFVLGIAFCIVVLWPPGDDAWIFVNSPKQLINDWVKVEQNGKSMPLFLAECLEDDYDKNEKRLLGLYRWFQAAAVSVGAAVILGCIQLAVSN
jgi:hypothetical protein